MYGSVQWERVTINTGNGKCGGIVVKVVLSGNEI